MAGGFDSLGLMPELLRSIDELGWTLPTDVQDEAIPLILGGGDVMAAAETGSGKTAAFCLPIIQCVHERLRDLADESKAKVGASSSGGGGGGKGAPTFEVKLNENDKDALVTVSADGLNCSSSAEKAWTGIRATHGVKSGRYYFEATINGGGIARVGWSSMAAHLELGRDAHGFGYGGTGMKSHNNQFEAYGGKYGNGDVVGCLLDFGSREISFSVNGQLKGAAFQLPEGTTGSVLFPALCIKNISVGVNFGQTAFRHLPQGYRGLFKAEVVDIVSVNEKAAFVAKGKRTPLAIILEPARDLAEQVFQQMELLTRYVVAPSLKSLLLVGGDKGRNQTRALEGGVDVVVGTLGKVTDMVKAGALDLSQIRFFVMDEADRLTEPENLSMIMHLYGQCPGGGSGDNRLQVCFFSATLHSPEITSLSEKLCVNPTWVDLKGVDAVPETVHHVVYEVNLERDLVHLQSCRTPSIDDAVHASINNFQSTAELKSGKGGAEVIRERKSLTLKRLKQQLLLKVIDTFQMSQCMIFCRTNVDCDNLETFLCNHGGGRKFTERAESGKEHEYSCCVLGGMRSMEERRRNLEAFKEGDVRFLICTDVAARGIDIQGLPFVINMTLPDEAENYIHRIGRVGRAERMGLAISIVAGSALDEKVWYHTCANRGRGCSNRELKENGGCTIWMSEHQHLQAVTARLHMTEIPRLSADFSLPPELANLGTSYGELATNEPTGGHVTHVDANAVVELARMEIEAQNNFLLFKSLIERSRS